MVSKKVVILDSCHLGTDFLADDDTPDCIRDSIEEYKIDNEECAMHKTKWKNNNHKLGLVSSLKYSIRTARQYHLIAEFLTYKPIFDLENLAKNNPRDITAISTMF